MANQQNQGGGSRSFDQNPNQSEQGGNRNPGQSNQQNPQQGQKGGQLQNEPERMGQGGDRKQSGGGSTIGGNQGKPGEQQNR